MIVETKGVRAEVADALTNGAQILQRRIALVLMDRLPELLALIRPENKDAPPDRLALGIVGRFANGARITRVTGLSFTFPALFASEETIWQAWQAYLADDPTFWEALDASLTAQDASLLPPGERPEEELTEQERKDPNSVPAAENLMPAGAPN